MEGENFSSFHPSQELITMNKINYHKNWCSWSKMSPQTLSLKCMDRISLSLCCLLQRWKTLLIMHCLETKTKDWRLTFYHLTYLFKEKKYRGCYYCPKLASRYLKNQLNTGHCLICLVNLGGMNKSQIKHLRGHIGQMQELLPPDRHLCLEVSV